jgi:hypothetical protein
MFIYMKFKKNSFINCLVSAYIALYLNNNHGDQQKSTRSEEVDGGPVGCHGFRRENRPATWTPCKGLVNHLGYLARDRIPINVREWKKNKQRPEISYVSDCDKELVWGDVLQHFMLDTNDEQLKERVQD